MLRDEDSLLRTHRAIHDGKEQKQAPIKENKIV